MGGFSLTVSRGRIRALTMKFLISLLLIMVFFLAAPMTSHGRASVNVNTLDSVYRDIDKLVSHGLVKKIIMGQRPFSRREIARITAEAMRGFQKLKQELNDPNLSGKKRNSLQKSVNYISVILDRMTKEYREELIQSGAITGEKQSVSIHGVEKVDVDMLFTNSPAENLPISNGLGEINAVINPLVDYQQGRHLVEGYNFSVESTHWLRASDYFALFFQPRFQLGISPNNKPNDNNVYIMNLYGKLNFKNFEIQVGRDNLFWGQGLDSGLLLSNNPRGLDMVKLSNDIPGVLPWVFKYLGAHKLAFFYADLGPEQNFPNAYLVGFKYNIQPLSFFELGLGLYTHSGGAGSPPASFKDRVENVFAFNPGSIAGLSNKLGGFDMRFRIPPARGMEIYAEGMYDDTRGIDGFNRFFWQDAGYIFGVHLPRVTHSGNVDLRMEYHKTGVRMYRHTPFTSGLTLNQYILGDNLGPDAYGIYLVSNWDYDSQNLFTFRGAFESRSSDIWGANTDERGIIGDFFVVQANPKETRYRVTTQWLHRFADWPVKFKVNLGYEYVNNFGFTEGVTRNNFLGAAAFEINLDQWTQLPKP